jgi:hypothetical protein
MKFADLKDQIIADAIDAWLALKDPASALKEFQNLSKDAAESDAGLHCRYKIAIDQEDTDTAVSILAAALEQHQESNWALLTAAAATALNGNEQLAVEALKARHTPPLKDWTIALMMAHTVAEKIPQHARGYFATACNLCPEHMQEFVVESALDHPALAAVIQNKKN